MDQFGLVDVLRAYCASNDIKFLYGTSFYQNIEASSYDYEVDQLVLGADFNARPLYNHSNINEISYVGTLMLGRKFEESTVSSLDETYIQKYDNRLKELSTLLGSLIGTIACDNELEAEGVDMRFDINRFDTNIDFVVATVTFVQ